MTFVSFDQLEFLIDLAERYVQAEESKAQSLENLASLAQYLPESIDELAEKLAVSIEVAGGK